MAKELEGLEEGSKAEIHIHKKYQIGKHQGMIEYMDSGSSNSPPFITD